MPHYAPPHPTRKMDMGRFNGMDIARQMDMGHGKRAVYSLTFKRYTHITADIKENEHYRNEILKPKLHNPTSRKDKTKFGKKKCIMYEFRNVSLNVLLSVHALRH